MPLSVTQILCHTKKLALKKQATEMGNLISCSAHWTPPFFIYFFMQAATGVQSGCASDYIWHEKKLKAKGIKKQEFERS